MSIFTKVGTALFGPIIKRVIRKELMSYWKDFIQPLLDFLTTLVQPQQGTKFLVTVLSIGAIVLLSYWHLATTSAVVVIGVMPPVYYVADILYKGYLKPKTEEKSS